VICPNCGSDLTTLYVSQEDGPQRPRWECLDCDHSWEADDDEE
jgi:transposase-like protein